MKLTKTLTLISIALILQISLSGCAKNMVLKRLFRENPEAKVGIAIEAMPTPSAHKKGTMGLLDMEISASMNSFLREHLEETDCSPFLNIKEKLAARVHAGGLKPIIIDDFIDVESLPKIKNRKKRTSPTDFSSIAQKYDVDYILLLKMDAVGTVHYFFGFIPMGAPSAYCVAGGLLVQGKTNEKYWSYIMDPGKSQVRIEEKWNNPPEYSELDTAIQKAITKAVTEVETNFN
jgi:hypothetical protein